MRVFTVAFAADQMREWFGGPLPRLGSADEYRMLFEDHVSRLDAELALIDERLANLRPPGLIDDDFLTYPLSAPEQALLGQRDLLESALARLHFFLDAEDTEWVVRYPVESDAALELVPLTVERDGARAPVGRGGARRAVDRPSWGGPRRSPATSASSPDAVRAFASESPFAVEQRLIEYRPVGALSKATLSELEPALFDEVAAILAATRRRRASSTPPRTRRPDGSSPTSPTRAPAQYRRVIFVESSEAKARALEQHRASPRPTVLLSPSLREGVDLPDDFLRFQIITKMPYPDLGDPWTAARQARDPRWYALETAKALVQAYGRSCRHADDHGVTYILDAQFARFLQRYRPLLPAWFREAAEPAVRAAKARRLRAGTALVDGPRGRPSPWWRTCLDAQSVRTSIIDERRGGALDGRGTIRTLRSRRDRTRTKRPSRTHRRDRRGLDKGTRGDVPRPICETLIDERKLDI